jgi:Ran-binding protein 3
MSQGSRSSSVSTRSSTEKASLSGKGSAGAVEGAKGTNGDKTKTSAPSFANSTFAKLASSQSSPFGMLAMSGKPSVFGSSLGGVKPTLTSSTPAIPSSPPKLSFGGGASPFAGLNGGSAPSVFGSSFASGGFGGNTLAGPRLTGFGKPGNVLKSDKPARPFGAPESDAEDDGKDGDDDGETSNAAEVGSDKESDRDEEKEKEEAKATSDDKKKPKLHKSKSGFEIYRNLASC